MLDGILKNKIEIKYFFYYCLIGVSGVVLDLFIFYILVEKLLIYYQYANIISVSCGIINNFILNVKYNFNICDNYFKRLVQFYATGMVGLLISGGLLFIAIEIFGLNVFLSKFFTIFIVTIIQYTLNRLYSLKKS